MRHTFTCEGFGIRLRPVVIGDARFIVNLRNSAHARGRIGDTSFSLPAQEQWLRDYFERPGDYYFIVETLYGIPVGTYSVYDVSGASAEVGRWVILPDVPAALPSAITLTDFAFGTLRLEELHGTVVQSNGSVQSFNRKLGFRDVRVEKGGRVIGGLPVDIVHNRLCAHEWPACRRRVLPLAAIAQRAVMEWDQAQRCGVGADIHGHS
jgi:RimJ/RimL family protein N-acetyltransferase